MKKFSHNMKELKCKFKEKENLLIFLLILVVSIILCLDFLKFHTVPDTYTILADDNYNSKAFLKDGRIITSAYLYVGKALNIPVQVLAVFMEMVSIVCLSISVYIIYTSIINKNNNYIIKLLILMGSYLYVFNPLAIEHFAYVESGIIILGKLLCIVSAKKLVIQNKKIIPFILVIIAGICYQGILNIFITTSILFMILQKDKNKKDIIKQLIWISIICLITLLIIVGLIKGINGILKTPDERIGKISKDRDYVESLITYTNEAMTRTWNLFSRFLIPNVIMFTIILFIGLQKYKYILKYCIISLIAIFSCTVPILLQTNLSIEARKITSVGAIIGISIILLTCSIIKDKNRIRELLILFFAIIIFSINSCNYINDGIMLSKSNIQEKEYLQNIASEIKKYEEKENKKINVISFYYDRYSKRAFFNFPDNSFNIKSLYTDYARKESIEYFVGHKVKEIEPEEKYQMYFINKDWNEFSKEQLIFEDDKLYLCVF